MPDLIGNAFFVPEQLLTSLQMQKNTLLLVIAALFVGFVAGFWLANSINRTAVNVTTAQPPVSSNANSQLSNQPPDLTEDEINAKIAEADKNAGNFSFQKDLGIALYTYGVMKKDASLFPKAVRILERANSLNSKDFDVLVTLGNAYFDTGFAEKNVTQFQKARETYTKALEMKPNDENVQTDIGISYVVQQPPAYDKGAAELQKALDRNPANERALIYLVRALVGQNKLPDAEKALAKLKGVDPNNNSLSELTSLISNARNDAK